MKFSTHAPSLQKLKTDLLGLAISEGKLVSSLGRDADRKLGGLLSNIIKKEELKGKAGEARLVDTGGKIGAGAVLLIGVGDLPLKTGDVYRKSAAKLVRAGGRIKAKKVSLEDFGSFADRGHVVAEGAVLGAYSFTVYKSKKDSSPIQEFEILSNDNRLARQAARGQVFAESTNFARDLINTPANDMTPRRMADEARKIGRLPRVSAKIFDQKALEKMGMGCYLSVSHGSDQPPYFLHLQYRPSGRSKKRIVFVGKGITFDSGGLSIKPANSMETMKDDMSGAAAMLGVMRALSVLKPDVEVHGISAVTENMVNGSATKPGDIVKTLNGKTVEILNTDAEGRLTLADALTYALRQKPDILIDAATLTGACVVALGDLVSGILGNDQKLIDTLIACGKESGEQIWQLPLVEDYKTDIKSSIADLKNIGGRGAGTTTAALFLQEFTDPKVPWAHIDIAGPSWTEKDLEDCPRGGTGHIVRTILNFILKS